MMTRAMHRGRSAAVLGGSHRRPSAAVLGGIIVALLALLASSPAAAHCGLSHYRSKPKEIVVVGATAATSSRLHGSGRRTITDVTMKRGVVGAGHHPDMLWFPTWSRSGNY